MTATSQASNNKRASTIGYYAACAALGLVSASLGPTLPGLAAHTRAQLHQISALFPARSFGYLLGAFQSGRLYDRMPGHRLLVSALLVMAALMASVPLLPSPWLLFIAWLIAGLAEGAVDVGVNALLMWVHPENLGPYMNALHFFFGVGAFISPIIVAQAVSASGDITWAYWAIALLILPVAAWLVRLPSPDAQAGAQQGPAGRTDYGLIALTALLLFFYLGAESSFGGWIYTYATRLGLADTSSAAYLNSAFWGALTVGRLLAIPIAMRLRPGAILLADLLTCLASVGLIVALPRSLAAIWIGTVGIGLGMASVFPVALSLAQSRAVITGKITSFFFIGSSCGSISVPWLIGQLFEPVGPRIAMIVIFGDLLAASLIFGALVRRSTRPVAEAKKQQALGPVGK